MKNKQIFTKMIKYIDNVFMYTEGIAYEEFKNNTMLVDACVFNLSQIGELVKNVDKEITDSYPHIPWRQMYGLRNRIVHDYEGINLKLVWEVITLNLEDLKQEILKIDV